MSSETAERPGSSITVVAADDDVAVLDAISDLVRKDPALRLLGTATGAEGVVALIEEHRPDVAILDVRMPGGGIAAARECRRISPQTRILAFSAHEERDAVVEMLRAGATGYVVKGSPGREVIAAIRGVVRGEVALSPQIAGKVVDEMVALLHDSARMADQLSALDRTSKDIIHVLAHELLTPLTIVQGTIATLHNLGADLSERDAEEMVASAARAGDRLRRLVRKVSLVELLERSEQLETTPLAAEELLTSTLAEFPADRERIRAVGELDARIVADAASASRALSAVLENAFQFGPPEEPIDISATPEGSFVVVEVADRGPGIPPDMREAVLQPLVQGEGGATRGHQGLGIGLFLARRVMELHGGRVMLDDREGGGTTVRLFFPRDDG